MRKSQKYNKKYTGIKKESLGYREQLKTDALVATESTCRQGGGELVAFLCGLFPSFSPEFLIYSLHLDVGRFKIFRLVFLYKRPKNP